MRMSQEVFVIGDMMVVDLLQEVADEDDLVMPRDSSLGEAFYLVLEVAQYRHEVSMRQLLKMVIVER